MPTLTLSQEEPSKRTLPPNGELGGPKSVDGHKEVSMPGRADVQRRQSPSHRPIQSVNVPREMIGSLGSVQGGLPTQSRLHRQRQAPMVAAGTDPASDDEPRNIRPHRGVASVPGTSQSGMGTPVSVQPSTQESSFDTVFTKPMAAEAAVVVPELTPDQVSSLSAADTMPADRVVRVEVDAELAIEVAVSEKGVEVILEGTKKALEEMELIDAELDREFASTGQSMDFHARERSDTPRGSTPKGTDWVGANEETIETPISIVPRGRVVNTIV
ncbi:MAG: hypothetical protein GWP91_12620 [Rhodobacterales bacterium]|nr:hypothetical protein [Rhodobacterales bacterium]